MASLFEAIVLQNLTVLTRGNTLLPNVLLLGGPNTFIVGMQVAEWGFVVGTSAGLTVVLTVIVLWVAPTFASWY